jgi:hypothetical protein
MESDPPTGGEQQDPGAPREPATPTSGAPAIEGDVFDNRGSATILITEDKLRLALQTYADALSGLGWVAPLGILVPLLAALATFSDFSGTRLLLHDDAWRVIFIVAAIVVGIWLVVAVIKRLRTGGRRKSIDACVSDIKGEKTARRPRLGP